MIIDNIIRLFEEAVSILTLAVIVVLVLVQVFFRYVLSSGILWIDELVINLMVLLVLVGAALATRHGVHTDLRMFLDGARPGVRLVLKIAGVAVTLVFLLALIYASAIYAYDSRRLATTMIGIPLWLAYGIIPFSGMLILYEFLKLTIRSIRDRRFNAIEPM
jgi:C4-dicarboxylate transporter DctQ subunit